MLKRTAMIVAAWLCLAAPAAAQYTGPRQLRPTSNAIWGELGFFTGDPLLADRFDTTIVSPLLRGYIGVGALEIDFAWGFAFADIDNAVLEESAFRLGNPYAGLRFKVEQREWIMRIGGGLALPVASVDGGAPLAEQAAQFAALGGAEYIRGRWDQWLWAPERFTMVVPSFRMDGKGNDFVWALEAAMGIMVDTSDGDRDTEVPLQLAAEGGARLGRAFVIGGRFQSVFTLTAEGEEDAAQLAVEPFVRVEGERGFGYAKMTINLDNPLGFAFDDDGVWGLHVGGGARF